MKQEMCLWKKGTEYQLHVGQYQAVFFPQAHTHILKKHRGSHNQIAENQ